MFVGSVIAAVLAVTGTGDSDATRPAPSVAPAPITTTVGPADLPVTVPTTERVVRTPASSEDQLHQDYNMTQYMSDPNASGPMFTGPMTDPQLQHSSNPAFVRELEQHQADIDRMLARGTP